MQNKEYSFTRFLNHVITERYRQSTVAILSVQVRDVKLVKAKLTFLMTKSLR